MEDDGDDGVLDGLGAEALAGAGVNNGDATVDAGAPAIALPEVFEHGLVHEEDDLGSLLGAELDTHGGGEDGVVVDDLAVHLECALAVLSADEEAGLDDAGEHQHPGGLANELLVARAQVVEVLEDGLHVRVDLLLGGGAGGC